MEGLLQDLRFAARRLLKDRWFTAATIVALALGIGANSAVFTLVNAVLLRGLPFDQPDRIMWIDTHDAKARTFGVSVDDYGDWRAATRTFTGIALVQSGQPNLSGDGRLPEAYPGGYVTANTFDLIGVQPILGRGFVPADDAPNAPAVVLISAGIWKSRYASDAGIIGKPVNNNAIPSTIIGVMPDGFKWPFQHEVWTPMAQLPQALRRGRGVRGYLAYGRLADGVTIEQARSEMSNISAQLAAQYPDTNKDITAGVMPFVDRMIGRQIHTVFWSLMGAVGFVLLIACANVANLLLARAAHRTREIAVRVALGATRWRIVRQLLVESVLLACISGVVGLGLGMVLIRWFDRETMAPEVGRPYWMVFTMDTRVLLFFMAVCLLTGLAFGLAPALHVSKTNVNEVLKEGGRSGSGGVRSRRWTSALIVTELALTLVLLAGAGFMMRSFLNMYGRDVGFDSKRLLTMTYVLPTRKYATRDIRMDFMRRMEDRLNANGEIQAASIATNQPLSGGAVRQLEIDGKPAPAGGPQTVTIVGIGPRYFDALGVSLIRGRSLDGDDGTPGREVAIINQRLAFMYFGNQNPIGQRIRLADDTPAAPQYEWATIIAVVPSIRQRDSQENPEPDPVVYLPHRQNLSMIGAAASIIVRGRPNPGELATLVRKEISGLDPDLSMANIRTMDVALAQQRGFARIFGTLFVVFAAIAIVLAAVGLFAVTAYSVTQRTQEIGVRMALGAQAQQVSWLILRRGLVQLAIGLSFGLAGAYGVGRLLQSMLFQTGPSDPVTLVAITLLLSVVAIAACLWPAWQATRLNPVNALRYD